MFSRSRVAAVAVAALVAAAAGAITSYASSPDRGHGSARAAQAGPPPAVAVPGWGSVAEVRASLAAQSDDLRSAFGLTVASIAATRVVYTFPAGTPSYAGVSVYEVPRTGRGSCFYVLDGGTCAAYPASLGRGGDAMPVQVGTYDLDGPQGAIPLVVAGDIAPQVKAVTFTCVGESYAATLSGNVVAWVAPSAGIGARDCLISAQLANGGVWTDRL